jgi:hypothetical protein
MRLLLRAPPKSHQSSEALTRLDSGVRDCGANCQAWTDRDYRAPLAPLQDGAPRPLWSVMIPTYNCAFHLRETLRHVLDQDPGPDQMQIEVVDDSSTLDDPLEVVRELGRGRVGFYRQDRNVGHVANFNTCLELSRGQLVHLLHGDDYVRRGFYGSMERAFARPEVGAAFCRFISVDERGHWQTIWPLEQPQSGIVAGWLERIAAGQRLQPPSMVVRREVYEHLGGFDQRIRHYGEDWEMWVHIASHYRVWYEPQPLAVYRARPASLSGRSLRSGENLRDLRTVIEINRARLPAALADRVSRQARESAALAALRRARRMAAADDPKAAHAQVRGALRCSRSPRVLCHALYTLGWWIYLRIRRSPEAV